ncbi:MAG TPA: PucR family transcriptional regulator ligand-binding domain-containing protein [Solirubrobacterales bacterium]|jgi:purine catabolism regulator
MLTVGGLVEDCGLELATAASGADNQVRWVHITEHEDPTPWLSGGELLLTTGYNLGTPAKQRRYVELLAGEGLAGLGFGVGFDHKRMPKAILDAATAHELPLFEVPYEMPFIAITERAAARLVNEQFGILERGVQVHERLERLVIEGHGLDEVLTSTGAAIGGTAIVLDRSGRELARSANAAYLGTGGKELADEIAAQASGSPPAPFAPEQGELAGRVLAVPVPGRRGDAPVAWLAVISERDPLGDFERLCARQAAIVVGLELMRERIVRETERRLAGDLLADALGDRLEADELSGRLRPFGIGGEAAVLIFELDDPPAAEATLEAALAEAGVPALVATSSVSGRPLLCAVVDTGTADPVGTARRAREALTGGPGQNGVRAAASRPAGVGSLRRAFHEARCALEATSLAEGEAPDVASHRDLGAFTLLLALQDDDALRLYSDGLLDPIEQTEGEYGGELLRSLEAFIENNGNWERAARQLYCHRHTLRYRIRKIEELTGRDLSRATDRIELWLALRARELVK